MISQIIIGYLGKDATISEHNGNPVANFSVASSKKVNGQDVTTWVECSLWNKPNLYPYLKKGQQVYLSGEPGISIWGDAGEKKASMKLNVFEVQLLGGKG